MSIDTSKIIHAPVGGGRYTVTAPIVKEDYGLYLKIEGLELPETYQVDFSNDEHNGTSVTMIGNADGVLIPSQFISSGKDVFAFLYHVGADFGRTVYKFRIPNKLRPDRTNVTPTPEEQGIIDQAISALNDAVEEAQGYAQTASEKADSIHDMTATAETLPEGSEATASYNPDTGVMSFGIPKGTDGQDGDDGYSPTASVSKSGNTAMITITDKNGTTSAQVSDGTDGTDGISPTVTITSITGGHRITITDADGTETADVMDGVDGQDYILTVQDKQEIAELVSDMYVVTVSGSEPTIVAESNHRYVCGEVASLDFTPSASGFCEVIFTSGTTATVLNLPASVKMPDWWIGTEANATYELSILDGIYGAVMSWS